MEGWVKRVGRYRGSGLLGFMAYGFGFQGLGFRVHGLGIGVNTWGYDVWGLEGLGPGFFWGFGACKVGQVHPKMLGKTAWKLWLIPLPRHGLEFWPPPP